MKHIPHLLRLLVCLALVAPQSVSGITRPAGRVTFQTPEIRKVKPARAVPGQQIVIKGRNFSPSPVENEVLVGGLQAEVTKAKRKKLFVILPEDLTPGPQTVMVLVNGAPSDIASIEILTPITPMAGDYIGQTAQGQPFNFTVLVEQETVTSLSTGFSCSSDGCSVSASVQVDRFADLINGYFDLDISTPTFSDTIKGTFTSETKAEGTVEFRYSSGCTCQTGKIRWTAVHK